MQMRGLEVGVGVGVSLSAENLLSLQAMRLPSLVAQKGIMHKRGRGKRRLLAAFPAGQVIYLE